MLFQGLLDKKARILLFFSLFLVLILSIFNFYFFPLMEKCLFTNPLVCLSGRKYKKFNWEGRGFKFKSAQEVKAPFSGSFFYSPSGTINYEGKEAGVTGVIVFKNENLGMIKLYIGEINKLWGETAVEREVKKGEIVAEILPKGIEFLDNFNAVEVKMLK